MNRILIMALVVLLPAMMQACKGDKNGKGKASAEAQSAQPEQLANVAFLKSLDLDLSRVAIGATFDTKFLLTEEGEKKRVQLNEHQIDALLDDAPVDFDDECAVPFIVGAKAFGKHVMLVFRIETGDGAELIFSTYNQAGKMVDFVATASWESTFLWDGEVVGGQPVSYDSCYATFSNQTFTFHRKVGRHAGGVVQWEQQRTYAYQVGANGKITLSKVDVKAVKGAPSGQYNDPLPEMLQIRDLSYYPYSDTNVLAAFNEIAKTHFNNANLKETLLCEMFRLYNSHKDQVLLYIDNHPDSAMTGVLHECVKQSWLPKEELYDDIDDLKNSAQKARLMQLTAQWGPDGAVG